MKRSQGEKGSLSAAAVSRWWRRLSVAVIMALVSIGLMGPHAQVHAAGTPVSGYTATDFATDFPSNGYGPIGVAFDASGTLFAMDIANGYLYKFGAGGGPASTPINATPMPDQHPAGLAFGKDGSLYLARQQNPGDVVQISPTDGTILRTLALIPGATGLATDPLSGDLFVSGGTSGIVRISNPSGCGNPCASPSVYVSLGADGLTFAPDGTLYAASGGCAQRITGTNQSQPATSTQIACVSSMDGIALAPSSDPSKPYIFTNNNDGSITEIDQTVTTPTTTQIVTGGTRGDFVAVDSHQCLFATQSSSIEKVTKSDGSCFWQPTGVLSSPPLFQPTQQTNWEKWSLKYGISPSEGLVVGDVSLGQRFMAERMGLAYLKLITCAGSGTCIIGYTSRPHIVLAPNADETSANGGVFTQVQLLPNQPTFNYVRGGNVPNQHVTISATYRVWLGPMVSSTSSYLDVTQNYSFYKDFPEAAFQNASCEPSTKLGDCARFKTEVTYNFHLGVGASEHVQSVEAAERLHFTPDGLADRGTTFTQDCDAVLPVCSNQLGQINGCAGFAGFDLGPQVEPLCKFPASDPQDPLLRESVAVGAYPSPGIVDNIHQTPDESVQLPEGSLKGDSPGCVACVHIHWRWGKAVCSQFQQFPCGNGNPLLCDTPGQPYPSAYTTCSANQKVIGALVTYHSEETVGVSNFMDLLQGANANDLLPSPPCFSTFISCIPLSPEGTQGSEALLQAPGACYDQGDLLSWGQCGVVTWLDDTASRRATVSDADSGTLFAFGGFFCADPSCRSQAAQFIDPLAPTYSVPGGGSITSLQPGQQFSMQFTPPVAVGDVHFFADLLPPGTSNIQVNDPNRLCGAPFIDGSGLTTIKCAMPTLLACLNACVTITANAPTAAGTYANYIRAVWGSSTDPTAADGGNYRKADVLVVK